MQAPTTRGAVCTGLAVLFPSRGPTLPSPGCGDAGEARLRRERTPGAGEAAPNGGAGAGERAPAGPGTGRGDTHRSGRAGRPHPGAPAARQDGSERRSHREGESVRPPAGPVRSPPTAQANAVSLPPNGARGPQLRRMPPPGPHPFPRPPPLLHPFPSPLPPTPTRMENTSRGGGRRGHASLKGSLP